MNSKNYSLLTIFNTFPCWKDQHKRNFGRRQETLDLLNQMGVDCPLLKHHHHKLDSSYLYAWLLFTAGKLFTIDSQSAFLWVANLEHYNCVKVYPDSSYSSPLVTLTVIDCSTDPTWSSPLAVKTRPTVCVLVALCVQRRLHGVWSARDSQLAL